MKCYYSWISLKTGPGNAENINFRLVQMKCYYFWISLEMGLRNDVFHPLQTECNTVSVGPKMQLFIVVLDDSKQTIRLKAYTYL